MTTDPHRQRPGVLAALARWVRGVPVRDPRFWVIQVLVLAIDTGHSLLEDRGVLEGRSALYLLSVSVFLIPLVYAALGFGMRGAVPTALWALVLSLPEISQHDPTTRIGILVQFAILLGIGVIVARRVDRERAALASLTSAKRNLETYIELATDAQEEERKRLSRELHDDILQSLVVATSQIGSAAGQPPDLARARLASAQGVLGETIVNVRRYCRALRPSLLDDLGLVDALEWLVGDLRTRTGLAAELDIAGPPVRLEGRDELLIFRIVQEALHNVERHSRATRATVHLRFDDSLTVVVTDNGRGMTRRADRDDEGLGLRGMDERTKLLRGRLTVRSASGQGTELTLTVPLTRSDTPAAPAPPAHRE